MLQSFFFFFYLALAIFIANAFLKIIIKTIIFIFAIRKFFTKKYSYFLTSTFFIFNFKNFFKFNFKKKEKFFQTNDYLFLIKNIIKIKQDND